MKIKFENITFHYNNILPTKKPVLNNISFEISDNEFIGLIGPSGSGKTTLVQLFTGLIKPTIGNVYINNIDILSKEIDIDDIRKRIGLVFQFPESQIFEETVYNDIAFGPKNFGLTNIELKEIVKSAFALTGLDFESMQKRSPFTLSEGEKRRVALAGILSMNPEVLILDEPTACLDAGGVKKIEQILTTLNNTGKTIVLVSHNIDLIAKLCNRIIILQEGNIVFDDKKENLFLNETILKQYKLAPPRIYRFCKKLQETGYISKANMLSTTELKALLNV